MGIEHPPYIAPASLLQALAANPQGRLKEIIDCFNDSFEYWSAVKYKRCPEGMTPVDLWTLVKAARAKASISVWERYGVTLALTGRMQLGIVEEIALNKVKHGYIRSKSFARAIQLPT